jgi:hypothetical protein
LGGRRHPAPFAVGCGPLRPNAALRTLRQGESDDDPPVSNDEIKSSATSEPDTNVFTEAEPAPAFDFDQSGPEFEFDQSPPDPFDA